jgi:outer membrane protein OmpA-like peptidoglycan-associated protein/tetratricopeptide (TPR) repeat protein
MNSKKITFLSLIAVLFSVTFSVAQADKKLVKKADAFFEKGNYKASIPLYTDIVKADPNNAIANFRLGYSYLKTIYKRRAMPYIKKAFDINHDVAPHLEYYLGMSYQYNHQFEEALKAYEKARLEIVATKDPEISKDLDRRIYESNNGVIYMKNPVKATIENIGPVVNSQYPDYAPVISADESVLVFCSRRPTNIGDELPPDEEYKYEDVYISYRVGENWSAPQNIGKNINTEFHDAPIALNADGTQLFIYKDDGAGDIFYSKLKKGEWSKPINMGKPINTPKYWEPSVSLTSDGSRIYFSSNRPGGLGGLDLYYCDKDSKGRWLEPVNMGPTINTDDDDDSPFIHADGRTLYFSSRGHNGMGGFDIYKTTLMPDGAWSYPEHLGYPINTADDDIYFVLSADNRHGYYASAMDGGQGEKDIVRISMPKPEEITALTSKVTAIETSKNPKKKILAPIAKVENINPITIFKGTVLDELTNKPLEANVTLIDNVKNEIITELQSNAENGKFMVIMPSGKNYGLTVQKDGYLFHSENFDIPPSNDYQEISKEVLLKKVKVGTKIVLRNIFFDFDKATLRSESTAELENLHKFLSENPKIRIEISGHTDNKGSSEYNKKLSESRAHSVVDYLVAKGIDKGRLTYAGYGFDRPLASNDTDEGRQLNRRTEFEILGQ